MKEGGDERRKIKEGDEGQRSDDADKRDVDCGIAERQFLAKKKELESQNMECLLIERPLISKTKRKLLILDVNGLLLHIDNKFDLPSDYITDKFISGKAILKRPSCVDFLKFCFQRFNDQSHCSITGFYTVENNAKPLILKELVKLWDKDDPNLPWEKREYNESNSLLVDDSPYKALLNNAHTAIFSTLYDFRNKNDNSLGHGGDIRMYLEGLATSENVQKYIQLHPFGQPAIIERHPCWQHYSQVNTLKQELLLCKEENEKFKEELKKKDHQKGDKEEVQPQTDKAVHHHVPNEDAEMVPNESVEMVINESPDFKGPSFSIGIPLSPIPKEKEKEQRNDGKKEAEIEIKMTSITRKVKNNRDRKTKQMDPNLTKEGKTKPLKKVMNLDIGKETLDKGKQRGDIDNGAVLDLRQVPTIMD
ncbi:hypothetical protein IFM89_000460 [Coptis chinensis]|uniref:Mitochondrial import inner membrane translocase subunit TIM50 n=1 Tax=Coptis chinensis TaxID=261450 RepID=A0A835IAY2_9MAGN|nr:hypothetical protein IFM89_000460 [Coptis chinensis]